MDFCRLGLSSVAMMTFLIVGAAPIAEESATVTALRGRIAAAKSGETVVVPAGDHLLRSALRIDGKRHFTLRGEKGARFVLHFDPGGPVASNANGLACSNCRDLTIENLRFTTDNPPSAVGRIVAKSAADRTIEIEILPPFKLTGREHLMSLTPFGEDRVPGGGGFETFGPQPKGLPYRMLTPTRLRTQLPGGVDVARIADNQLLGIRHELNGNCVMGFGCCYGVTVRDVAIERAMSAGTGIAPPCSDFLFERYSIGKDMPSTSLFSENSDGIHVVGLSGFITLRDCHFAGMGDDALNVHCKAGEVAAFDSATGELNCICRNSSRQPSPLPKGWAKAGDELIVYAAKTMLSKGRLKLVSYQDGRAKVEPGAVVPAVGDFLGNLRDYPRVTIEGCTFGSSRARGVLLQSHHLRIANCVFRNTASPGILLAPDVAYWNEAGPVEDVEITNCRFEHCMPHGGHEGILGAIAVRTNHQVHEPGAYPPGFHQDIRIVGNTFRDCGRSGIFMTSVHGAIVASNRFERCGASVKPGEPAAYARDVRFFNCADARAFDNVSDKPTAASVAFESSFLAQCRGRRPLVVNGDNDHYYKAGVMRKFVPLEVRLTKAGPRKYLDAIAAGGRVTHFFACAVGQRADYDSMVCDPIRLAIDEAKARGEKPDEWPVNAKKLHDLGVDPFAEWCAYGREKGISVWISQRMNDVHHVHRPWNIRTNRFWYDHPELHRSHGVNKSLLTGFWTDEALNYAFSEVREFEFAIFKELVDRYDADGFELDFMRFWQHLTPGREREEAPILTEFIRRCRAYANRKAAERGHAILLSTRAPSDYAAARTFGFDPETWAREGLVDLIVIANFWASEDFDFAFDAWKARLAAANPQVTVLPCACDNLSSGVSKVCPTSLEAVCGWADNAYALGAEGLYLFNVAYMSDAVQRQVYGEGLDPQLVAASVRRHVVTYHDCVPKGADGGIQLPIELAKGGSVRVRVGTPPKAGTIEVVFASMDEKLPEIAVRLNGIAASSSRVVTEKLARFGHAKSARAYRFPATACQAGANDISVVPSSATGRIIWAELIGNLGKSGDRKSGDRPRKD